MTARLVLHLEGVSLDVVTMLVRNDRVSEFQREGDGTFTVRTAPLNAVELAAIARELTMLDGGGAAETEIIPKIGRDPIVRSNGRGELYAYCPEHPALPLYRNTGGLYCTVCDHQTQEPPGARYANR